MHTKTLQCPFFSHLHLLGIGAANGRLVGQSAGAQSQAVLVAAGLVDTDRNPDAPRAVNAVGAGNQASILEVEVAVGVDLPASKFAVARGALLASEITENTLACKGRK